MKALHVLDEMTDISVIAFRLSEAVDGDRVCAAIVGRAGYRPPEDYVVLLRLADLRCEYDPFRWDNATMTAAHLELVERFDEIERGGVINAQPKRLELVGGL